MGIVMMLGLAGGGQCGGEHRGFSDEGFALAVYQLRRVSVDLSSDGHCLAVEYFKNTGLLMKILIATGGTGGHIFPAIETAKALRVRGHQVSFAGVLGPVRGEDQSFGFSCFFSCGQGP